MERITEKMLRYRFEILCKSLGKKVAESYKDIGAWGLSEYLGNWNIIEFGVSGSESNPLSCQRFTKRELFDQINFALRTIQIDRDETASNYWPKEKQV